MGKSYVILKDAPIMDYMTDYVALPKNYGTYEYFNREDVKAIRETVFAALDDLDARTGLTEEVKGYKKVIIKPNLVNVYLLDYLSPQPCLYIKALPRYSTLMGLLFSLLITFAYLAMFFYFIIHFFFGQEMTVIYSKETTYEDFSLNLTNRLFAFQFYNYTNSNIVDTRIATTAAYLWTYRGNETIIHPLQLERCQFDKHFPKSQYAFAFDNINIDRFTCVNTHVNNTNLSLYANQSDVSGTYIIIFLSTCMNSTANNNTCLPQHVIERTMQSNKYYFTALLENVNINHYNSTAPLSFAPFFNSYTFSYTLRTDMTFNWKPIEYTEDNGWLFVSERTYKNYIMEETLN
ncbi:MAG: hypothetical protein IIV27_08515, partial [Clostridia bacterium]|nr:hypothetical protein [Clostridia bacterium]